MMVTAIHRDTKSDKWIKEKMAKHRGCRGDSRRELIRQRLDNGYNDKGRTHEIYWLQGSPIKAYAVRVGNTMSFYEQSGKRWAIYSLHGSPRIKHEVSTKNSDLLDGEQV